jgi:hypothetical protein
LEDLDVDGRIVLKWIFKVWNWVALSGLIWLRIGKVAGVFKCGNETSGLIK